MPLLTRKRSILSKVETTYGVDPTPTGAANAILLRNLDITAQENELVSRSLIRPYMGNSEQLPASIRAMAMIEVEMAGSGTAGTAPAYDSLMRACGLVPTLLAATHAGTAAAGAATTITLAASASAVNDAYTGLVIRLTGGPGSGEARLVTAYNGTTKVATVASAWTVTPTASTAYSIDAQACYRPRSSGFESSTIYANVDGTLHKLTGARGSLSVEMTNKQIPVLKFNVTGLYNAVTDATAPTAVFSGFQQPLVVTNTNTPGFRLHGVSAQLSGLSLDMANNVVHRSLVGGAESVIVTDRAPSGNVTIEATNVATKDWWATARLATLSDLNVTHGTANGNIVQLVSGTAQLTKPAYSDQDGVQMLGMGWVPTPGLVGDDEIAIVVR